jgi:hypothetical protein
MKLSQVKEKLKSLDQLKFQLPDSSIVPEHFHVTEVGLITKDFIDCGGVVRSEKVVNFQLWEANDFDHRLAPEKLLKIIKLSEKVLGIEDFEVEVEYQADTIGKYGLAFDGQNFQLTSKFTDCLAKDNCGIPQEKLKLKLGDIAVTDSCCTPGGGCC